MLVFFAFILGFPSITLQFREFLTSHVVEAYWLPDEGCLSPEELPMTEMTLASQW